MLYLGETGISKLYLGETPISKAYLGENLVWGGSEPQPMTLNLNGLSIGGINCNINGLSNQTLMGWVLVSSGKWEWADGPAWLESGGWGGTYFAHNSGTMEVRFGTGSASSKKQFPYTFQNGVWHHYCFTRGDGSYKFYLDGTLQETQSGSTDSSRNNGTIFYLTRGLGGGTAFSIDISIANYAAFSRTLTDSEVEQAYLADTIDTSAAPFNSNLLLGLNITEGSGDRIYDVVSGNYATITGTPQWNVPFNPTR